MSEPTPNGTPNGGVAPLAAAAAAPSTPPVTPPATPPVTPPANAPATTPPVDPLQITPPATMPATSEPLLPFDDLTTEWATKGELSEDTIKTIEAKGIPRNYVDVYLAGLAAIQQQTATQVFSVTGGEDNYKAMVGWATANLPPAEIEAYNNAMSNNDASRNLAVQGLFAKFAAANGSEGVTVQGTTTSTAPSYASWNEVKNAMKDKRYGKDRSYTAEVQNKLKNSTL